MSKLNSAIHHKTHNWYHTNPIRSSTTKLKKQTTSGYFIERIECTSVQKQEFVIEHVKKVHIQKFLSQQSYSTNLNSNEVNLNQKKSWNDITIYTLKRIHYLPSYFVLSNVIVASVQHLDCSSMSSEGLGNIATTSYVPFMLRLFLDYCSIFNVYLSSVGCCHLPLRLS